MKKHRRGNLGASHRNEKEVFLAVTLKDVVMLTRMVAAGVGRGALGRMVFLVSRGQEVHEMKWIVLGGK